MPSESKREKVPSKVANGRYEIVKKLGAGCFGDVYLGRSTEEQKEVAIKFEDASGRALQLEHEVSVLRRLGNPTLPQGIAEVFFFAREGHHNCMVVELLGRSLEDRVQTCKGKYNAKTATLVAQQVLTRVQYLHSKGIVHRDIKPENFMFGHQRNKCHHIYVIDFGLSKRYFDEKHVQMRKNLSLTGTARYASINAHLGVEQSRRDDLEAVGHMFLYFLRGSVPWSGLEAKTQEEKYNKIREKKEHTDLKELCKGYPEAFETYLRYCRALQFSQRPDYNMLKALFADLRTQSGWTEDHAFQWYEGKDLGPLIAVDLADSPQPDDAKVAPRSNFCFCGSASKVKD
mmetsp:Transcript_27080/g.62624  ORF Transcript_27080/g.62624 Transcript_27080/m.62624 type:complete len:344 (+) Transcript_27080:55-1086(+)